MHASAAHEVSPADRSSSADINGLATKAWDIRPPQVVKVAGIAGALALLAACNSGPPLKAPSPDDPISTVRYQCQQNKTMVADFYDGKSTVGPDGRPIPGGRVLVQLSDGRKFSLPQTLSGSGIRYADSSESMVFWSKGDTAFVEEGPNKAVTYRDCVAKKA
jgi:membrane-bound inhibitor of C-type lysozyme